MNRFIRLQEVLEITQLSSTTIWRLEKAGKFPKRRKIGFRAVAWVEDDVKQWARELDPVD